MKPHEEEWRADGLSLLEGEQEHEVGEVGRFYDEARARLAAQAPRMARLLLGQEWNGDHFACPWCRACKNCECVKFQGHAPDCELASVLRDAGVLE